MSSHAALIKKMRGIFSKSDKRDQKEDRKGNQKRDRKNPGLLPDVFITDLTGKLQNAGKSACINT
jgi:hypothetical protein